ncbi:MAG: hypothetical protein JNL42_16265 [Anaerolineae bacterium]|nr:hypothetical protein [Anaerolineae bacterium]
MMFRKRAAVVGMLIILSGCGTTQNCTRVSVGPAHSLDCSGQIDRLSASRYLDFDFDSSVLGMSVRAQIALTVTSGRVRVSYENADGERVVGEAAPGAPLALTEDARLRFLDEVRLTLEPVGGDASGISYQGKFESP